MITIKIGRVWIDTEGLTTHNPDKAVKFKGVEEANIWLGVHGLPMLRNNLITVE